MKVCRRLVANLCLTLGTLWTVARQAPLWDFPGKKIGVGCHFLLQGIFPTQGSNPHLLPWRADSLPLNHQGSPVGLCHSSNSQDNIQATRC